MEQMMTARKKRAETLDEFAQSLGISYFTVWRAAKSGVLRTIRVGTRYLVPCDEAERVSREGLQLRPKK